MRMWMVDPALLCRKHLLGEHVEMHMFAGTILKGKRLNGYVEKGLVETDKIQSRHDALADELVRRGYQHNSPLEVPPVEVAGQVSRLESLNELVRRCPECKARIRRMGC